MPRKPRRAPVAPRLETLEGRLMLSGDAASSLFVKFRAGISSGTQAALVGSIGGSVVETFPNGSSLVQVASPAARASALKKLAINRLVAYAEADSTFQIDATVPNDPGLSRQPGLESWNNVDINATTAWDTYKGNPDTIIAVIDSGLATAHPEFSGRLWVNTAEANGTPGVDDDGDGEVDDIHGWNFQNNTNNIEDDNGHGTHVTGIIAANGDNGIGIAGVNWAARIMPLKFIGPSGDGSVDDAVRAIYYAVDHGARVINASWGGGDRIRSLTDAIAYANAHDVVFVTAAGNESVNNGVYRSYPADDRLPNVLSVAALDTTGVLASFSNFGRTTVDLGAPGVNIRSTVPGGYATYSGTSMAAPYVTGVVSLLVGMHPEMRASQIVQRVLNAARPLPGLKTKLITGGIVDAANTVSDSYAAAHPGSFAKSRILLKKGKQIRIKVHKPKHRRAIARRVEVAVASARGKARPPIITIDWEPIEVPAIVEAE